MRKYRITVTDSKNEKVAKWQEKYADNAKDAGAIIRRAKDGDLDQIEVEEWNPLTNEYLPLLTIGGASREVLPKTPEERIPVLIRKAARSRKYASQEKYDAINTRQIRLKLNKGTDKDVLEWLDKQESKQGAIKSLIREQIKKESRGE